MTLFMRWIIKIWYDNHMNHMITYKLSFLLSLVYFPKGNYNQENICILFSVIIDVCYFFQPKKGNEEQHRRAWN